jgi:hypothetical protein
MVYLTDEGRQYAESHRQSIVARVALDGYAGEWPTAFVATSIEVMNEQGASQMLDRCVLCGEAVLMDDDPAEMHDPGMYDPSFTEEERMVAQERSPNHGIVHAQCGLDRGWVVS